MEIEIHTKADNTKDDIEINRFVDISEIEGATILFKAADN